MNRRAIVVVRDREPDAVCHPPPKAFTRWSDVTYVHAFAPGPLPSGSHYFFNCVRMTERLYSLAELASRRGAVVTFIVADVDLELSRFARERHANLVPAYGCAHQIGPETLVRIVRRILDGHRVVAEGFVHNSLCRTPSHQAEQQSTLVRILLEASRLANASTPTVAAVLSLHRTGSNFLRDLIGLTVSGRVGVFHEHAVPALSAVAADPGRPLFDQQVLASDPAVGRSLRRAMLRDLVVNASRRFIFVCEREPGDRLTSFFQKRHMGWLRRLYDPQRHALRDTWAIQRTFDEWLGKYVTMQRTWYQERLGDHFGLDVLACQRTNDGLLTGSAGPNTLVVVPMRRLNALRDQLAAAFGGGAYATVDANSLDRRGGREIDRAFRRQIRFNPAAERSLHEIPEVAYLDRVLPEALSPA